MSTGVTRAFTPEERELAKKQVELDTLERRLTQRELDLATLQAELATLNNHYLSVVGVRFAELDAIHALIAQLHARLNPQDVAVQQQAAEAQSQAHDSAQTASNTPPHKAAFIPSASLKHLYRQIARQLHPDLATDPEERARRHRFMTDVNAAYADGDEDRLNALLKEWQASPEAIHGDGVGAELIRLIRKIAQVEDRLTAIDTEIATLESSDLYQLTSRCMQRHRAKTCSQSWQRR